MQIENAIIQIHGWLGNTSGYYAIIMAGWGLWRFFRKQGIDSEYWGALVIEEGLILLHVLMGVFLYFVGPNWDPPVLLGQPIHILYGGVSALVLPAIFAVTKGKKERPQLLIYLLVNAILAFIMYRAVRTAGLLLMVNE